MTGIVRDPSVMERIDNDFNKLMGDYLMFPTSDPAIVNPAMTKARHFYFGPGESVNSMSKFENFTNLLTG